MRASAAALLAALLAIAPVGAKEPPAAPAIESVLIMRVDGELTVEPEGSVGGYRIDTHLTDSMHGMIDRAVRKWRFEPVLVDGQPRRAVGRMRLTLAATPAGKDYQVRIDNVVFPPSAAAADAAPDPEVQRPARIDTNSRRTKPPSYPRELLMAGFSGRVLMAMRPGADGRSEVVVVQSMLFDVNRGNPRNLARAITQFEQASVRAAREWQFEAAPTAAATVAPVHQTILTTVDFLLGEMGSKPVADEVAGKWRWVSRTPKRAIPWVDRAGTQDPGVSDTRDGEGIPLATSFKLRTAVLGTSL